MLRGLAAAMVEVAKNAKGNTVAVATVIGLTLIGLVSLFNEGDSAT